MKCGPDFSLENKHIGWIYERPKRQGKKKKKTNTMRLIFRSFWPLLRCYRSHNDCEGILILML